MWELPHSQDVFGWAPMVAERLFGWSSNPKESSYPQHGHRASGPSQKQSGACWKSYLAVTWEVKVLAIIDSRGAREEPLSDGLWNVQPDS